MIDTSESLVHIRLDKRRLLIPLDRQFSLESLAALESSVATHNGNYLNPMVGFVRRQQGRYPVFQLDDQWGLTKLSDESSASRQSVILLMQVEGHCFGLLCCDLKILQRSDLTLLCLPPVMCTADGLVSQVWIDEQEAVGLVFPVDLFAYLTTLGTGVETVYEDTGLTESSTTGRQSSLFAGDVNV